ncbi:MAG: hypothetical protein FWH27_17070 [Planctomycetaceae bacterium]|nr:hypothetical protein [Planctomycetaceae bacterium]
MSKQKLTLAIVLFLVGCGVVAIALRGTYCQNADSPETPAEVKVVANATTAELLCDAQTKFDAWRLVESLETVTAIQPEKNEQNLPHYSEYIPDGDIE